MLQIQYEDVNQYANQLSALKLQMMNVFQDIQGQINSLPTIWNSPASNQFQNEFQSLVPVFSTFVEVMDMYAQFLTQTASTYRENEEMLRNAIGS
ncbi:WXG100 family type VII secretion target [Floccifex sp.]|uniref:WXG100 family type VII secretion target n=1 Tax=Floccifex sp. TaxID=2815810 RepID=UPI003EFCF529